jgi:hypothetical protein
MIVFPLIFFSSKLFPQSTGTRHSSQIQFEVLGPGSLFSINIDSRFSKKGNGFGYRIGLGGKPLGMFDESCNTGGQISFPIGLNYIAGRKGHLVELGTGVVPLLFTGTKVYCPDLSKEFFGDEADHYFYILAGYRYSPVRKKGITYRLFISQLFQKNFPVKFWGGASLGYKF